MRDMIEYILVMLILFSLFFFADKCSRIEEEGLKNIVTEIWEGKPTPPGREEK